MKIAFNSFLRILDDYDVIPEEDKKLHTTKLPTDAWKRRDMQVAQYKAKKNLRSNVDVRLHTSPDNAGLSDPYEECLGPES